MGSVIGARRSGPTLYSTWYLTSSADRAGLNPSDGYRQSSSTFALEPSAMHSYPLILIANEPSAYRSLLASELPFLRHDVRFLEIDPDDLESAVATLHPSVVVCSRTLEHAHDAVLAVLILRAEEIGTSLQFLTETIPNPRLSDILGAIDRALPRRDPEASAAYSDN